MPQYPFQHNVPEIPSSRSASGQAVKAHVVQIEHWAQDRPCQWCGKTFAPRWPAQAAGRFCGKACSAQWRMSNPEHVAKLHTPEVAAKRGAKRSAWLKSGNPKAQAELARIAALNPTERPEVRAKISATLKEMGFGPRAIGGNGRGMTKPQVIMLEALGGDWVAEHAVSIKPREDGYPTHYKLDLALPSAKIGIEVDGLSHKSRRDLDAKKDAKLASLGWSVLRLTNAEILDWHKGGMASDHAVSMLLAAHGAA